MLETKNIKAPGAYEAATKKVAAFKEKVDALYSEMVQATLRKQEAKNTVDQLKLKLEQIYSVYRKETNKDKRLELEKQQAMIQKQIEKESEFADLDLTNFLTSKVVESDVYSLESTAKDEHNAYTSELVAYEKALRKAFKESIQKVNSVINHNDYKEAKRLLDSIEITIRRG